MKSIYTLILVLLAGTAFGQRNLPACPALDNSQTGVNRTQNWNNCIGNYADEDGRFAYQGEYQNGVPNGYGSETFSDGNKYFGELKNGWRNGQGTYTWSDGQKYVGEWKNQNRNGQGIFYRANGSIKESGIYKDNKLVTSQYIDPNSFKRIALGNTTKDTPDNQRSNNSITLDVAKLKCEELGFKPETEGFGKCVLQLTK
jgi:hypothetical protein